MDQKKSKPPAARVLPANTAEPDTLELVQLEAATTGLVHQEVGQVSFNICANSTEEITTKRKLPANTTEPDSLALAHEAEKTGLVHQEMDQLTCNSSANFEAEIATHPTYATEPDTLTLAQKVARTGILHQEVGQANYNTSANFKAEVTTKRELPAYTTEQDTLVLAQEAVRTGLIHQDVSYHLTSLHPQVPSSMKHRYLLTHLQGLSDSESFKKVLLEYQSRTLDVPLGPQHVSDLTEHLAGYAQKWRLIGTALRFKRQDLDNIQDNHASKAESLLHNLIQLLEDWLIKKHKHTPTPTVNTLKRALSSRIVGLGNVACELPTNFIMSEFPVADHTSPYSIVTMSIKGSSQSPQGVSINTRTYSVTTELVNVEENSPVLLEVQATAQQLDLGYHWCVNRQQLSKSLDSDKYTGIKKPILCIHKADIDMDGYEFTCEVITKSHSNIHTETKPITLKVSCPLDKTRDSLASMYLAQPEVPEDTWPPESSKKYINLALIQEGKKLNYGEEHVHFTIRNDMDNVLQHKQLIEYDDILKSLRSGQVLLVQGRPGCGKTTFVHKITRDWATTSDGPMRLVLLVSLRVLNTLYSKKPDLDLSDILQLFHKLEVSQKVLEERKGKGVCFIFDGLDEFSAPDSIVYRIIKKVYLNESTVIVASRPAAIAKLRSRADKVIEVLGFLQDQIIEYFDCYPFSTQSKSAQLKGYLSSHPNILHMCYLPIHAAMVAYLFERTGKVPRTETEMYKHFTRSTLVRSLSKKVDLEDIDVYNLSGADENLFSQICRLALEKTILNKQVMEQDEVRNYFQTKKDTDISLGLITIDRTAGLYNYMNTYTFLHLTFQEYLAAYHIYTLSYEEQNKLIQEHGHKYHMLVVWKFYCGLMKYDLKGCELFKVVLNEKSSLFHIQCVYESQQPITCNLVLEHTNASLVFQNEYLTIPDFTALGYILANASSPIALSLTECTIISNEGIDALLSETRDKSILLSTLNYKTNLLDEVEFGCLEKLILHSGSLELLNVTSNVRTSFIGDLFQLCTSFRTVTSANDSLFISCRHKDSLQELHVKHEMNDEVNRAFALNCTKWNHLHTLELTECFSRFGTADIADCLKHFGELKVLIMANNDITGTKAVAIFSSLKHCTALTTLDLHRNTIHEEGVRVVSLCLQHWPNLQELDLSYNRIGSDGAKMIADNLHHCTQLRKLNLAGNCFNRYRAYSLSILKHCTALTTLDLQCNTIYDEGARVVALCLQHWPNLQELDLSYNRIGNDGARMIADNLHHCTQLRKLSLVANFIDHHVLSDKLL